jgi:hypothetical protein
MPAPPIDPFPPREPRPLPVQARYANEIAYLDQIAGASIYPAVQNIILACRVLGLGTVITTNHIRYESEVKAVLGLPDDVDTFAMMPIGCPAGRFGPLVRRTVSEIVCADRYGAAWPGKGATDTNAAVNRDPRSRSPKKVWRKPVTIQPLRLGSEADIKV